MVGKAEKENDITMDNERVKNVLVVGAGMMGHSIAQIFAGAAFDVVLVDVDERRLTSVSVVEALESRQLKGQCERAMRRQAKAFPKPSSLRFGRCARFFHTFTVTDGLIESDWTRNGLSINIGTT